ncbi:Uncharacterised protein [Bordetella pertussis]|nr:Uncharacterised protein [Bordetella pertussis]
MEGEAFLISAMTPALPWLILSSMAWAKPRTSWRAWASRSNSASLRICRAVATSSALTARIFARISFISGISGYMRRILPAWHGPSR